MKWLDWFMAVPLVAVFIAAVLAVVASLYYAATEAQAFLKERDGT